MKLHITAQPGPVIIFQRYSYQNQVKWVLNTNFKRNESGMTKLEQRAHEPGRGGGEGVHSHMTSPYSLLELKREQKFVLL